MCDTARPRGEAEKKPEDSGPYELGGDGMLTKKVE